MSFTLTYSGTVGLDRSTTFQRLIDAAVKQWRTCLHACLRAKERQRALWPYPELT